MAILTLIVVVLLIIFILCSFVGLFRFLSDTKKYSSYFNELKILKDKAENTVVNEDEEDEVT